MMRKRFSTLMSLMVVCVFFLSACGGPASETPAALPASEAAPTVALAQPKNEAGDAQEPTPADAQEPAPAVTQEAAPDATSASKGAAVSDLGFKPDANGFSFPNYGANVPAKNLTEVEIRRLFGDQVCASLNNNQCTLTPPGKQWMEEANKAMEGGHCEGFAALSLLMFGGQIKPGDFGGAKAADLNLDNEKLQREIAYWFITQATRPAVEAIIKGTPNDILQVLKNEAPGGETYTLGIYKRDRTGGHAITPFGVDDKGGGIFDVLVYDNNYPKETRFLTIDSNANTWKYQASINPQVQPDLYEGDAGTNTLELAPSSSRLTQQQCPFCAESSTTGMSDKNGAAKLASPARANAAGQRYNQIFLDGEGRVLIMDVQGRRLGLVDGKAVNEIPGARVIDYKVAGPSRADIEMQSPEPEYWIPEGISVTVTIDGSGLKAATLTDLVMIGPGFSIGVEGISLAPDQKDVVVFDPASEMIAYDTDSSESPNIVVGIEQPGKADYYYEIQGADMQGGSTIIVVLDTKKGYLLINTLKLKNEGNFNLVMTRIASDKEETFTAQDIALKAGAIVYIDYANWKGKGSGLQFGVDTNGDGVIEDEYEVKDLAP